MATNISAIDLNLLVVFDAVMNEKSVSKAAHRIGVSQPAVSNALNKLRGHLQDQLFVRTTDGVRPTELAREIAADVAEGLRQLQVALEPRKQSIASMHGKFVLSMSEQTMIAVLPRLLRIISASEYSIKLHIKPKSNRTIQGELDSMQVDLAVGTVPNLPPRFDRTVLYHDNYVIMMARNNPLSRSGVSAEAFSRLEQIAVREDLGGPKRIDWELQACGTARNVVMNVTQYQVLPKVLMETSLIALVPRSVTVDFDTDQLFFQEMPFAIPEVEILSVIHRTRRRNAAIRWLQQSMVEACSDLHKRFKNIAPGPVA